MVNKRQQLENTKLIIRLGYDVIVLLMIGLSGYTLLQLKNSSENMQVIVDTNNEKTALVNSMRDAIRKRATSLRNIMLMDDVFDREAESLNFANYASEFADARSQFLKLGLDQTEANIFQRMMTTTRDSYNENQLVLTLLLEDDSIDTQLRG